MVQRLASAQLWHAVLAYRSEPKVVKRRNRYSLSKTRVWFDVALATGQIRLDWTANRRQHLLWSANALTDSEYQRLLKTNPAFVLGTTTNQYLWVDEAFYEVSNEYSIDQAVALARANEMKRARKVQRAIEMTQGNSNRQHGIRETIPDEVKHFIFIRDNGTCVHCGRQSELQYDHVIPLALGGSNEPGNLQLLCSTCNQRKGPNLSVNPIDTERIKSGRPVATGKGRETGTNLNPPRRVESVIPGPFHCHPPQGYRTSMPQIGGYRAHQVGEPVVVRALSKAAQVGGTIQRTIDDLKGIINESAEFLGQFQGVSMTVDLEHQPWNINFKANLDLAKDQKETRPVAEDFMEKCKSTLETLVATSTDTKWIVSQRKGLKALMDTMPAPDTADGARRAASWVNAMNQAVSFEDTLKKLPKSYNRFQSAVDDLRSRGAHLREVVERNLPRL